MADVQTELQLWWWNSSYSPLALARQFLSQKTDAQIVTFFTQDTALPPRLYLNSFEFREILLLLSTHLRLHPHKTVGNQSPFIGDDSLWMGKLSAWWVNCYQWFETEEYVYLYRGWNMTQYSTSIGKIFQWRESPQSEMRLMVLVLHRHWTVKRHKTQTVSAA